MSWDSSIGIVTGYGLDGLGLIPGSARLFSSPQHLDSGAHPASYPMGTGALSLRVKQQGHEADHSPPSSAEAKKGRAIPPLPHMSSQHSD
jgi:hypothetical protein